METVARDGAPAARGSSGAATPGAMLLRATERYGAAPALRRRAGGRWIDRAELAELYR